MCDKVPDDLAKALLESSFKESAAFWTRNTGYLTFQGILLGFTTNSLKSGTHDLKLLVGICLVGLVVSLMHFQTARVSAHYNHSWYKGVKKWSQIQLEATASKEWSIFHESLYANDKLPWPRIHSTSIATLVPVLFMFCWISLATYGFQIQSIEVEQDVAPQSATRSESDSEGDDKPQLESEPRPR